MTIEKYIALVAIIFGAGLILYAINHAFDGGGDMASLDLLPVTLMLMFAGAASAIGGTVYFLIRAFMAL